MKINTIYNEDCLDTMARMPDGFVDLTVTSPPYDNLRSYKNKVGENWGEHIWKPIIKELFRVTKVGGVVVWVVGDATIKGSETGTSFRQALWAMDCGFRLHDTMIYHKNNPLPLHHNRYQPSFEYMFVFSNGRPEIFIPIKDICTYKHKEKRGYIRLPSGETKQFNSDRGKRYKYRHNIFSYNLGKTSKHPAIYPDALANDHIISWSNPGDLVYDPFMGSGTTAKMSVLTGRNYVGSEISKEYCEIAEQRISLIYHV